MIYLALLYLPKGRTLTATLAMVLSCADYGQRTTVYVTTEKHARLPFSLYTVRLQQHSTYS